MDTLERVPNPSKGPSLGRRIADLMLDESFRDGIAVDDEGTPRIVVAGWDYKMRDVYDGIDDFGLPATLILPAGGEVLMSFTISDSGEGVAGVGEGDYVYDPDESLADFLMEVIKSGPKTLRRPADAPAGPPDMARQLVFQLKRAA